MTSRSGLAVLWIACAIGCREDELSKLQAIRDEVCACKSVACGDAAMQRVPVIAGAGKRRSQVIARAMLDCLARLYEGARPKTGPDVEVERDPGDGADGTAGSAR
jgi:hypothetical protein